MRLPSGDVATPWLASIPLISPTTLLVAGSMMWMLSPAEWFWMMRSLPCCAVAEEKDKAHRTIPTRAARPQRSTWFFVIVISHVQRQFALRSPCREASPFIRRLRYRLLLLRCSRHECFQRQPVRIGLRGELLATA